MRPTAATHADDEKRRAFAVELLRFRNVWDAAHATFPGDTYAAIECENTWPNDPVVIEHIQKLQSEKTLAVLPSRDDVAREFWKIGREGSSAKLSERMAALKAYSEVMEYTGKSSGPSVQITNNAVPHVLEVPQFGTPEEWEAKAKYQQRKLIEAAHGPAAVNPPANQNAA